jgi:hypothetical protein
VYCVMEDGLQTGPILAPCDFGRACIFASIRELVSPRPAPLCIADPVRPMAMALGFATNEILGAVLIRGLVS